MSVAENLERLEALDVDVARREFMALVAQQPETSLWPGETEMIAKQNAVRRVEQYDTAMSQGAAYTTCFALEHEVERQAHAMFRRELGLTAPTPVDAPITQLVDAEHSVRLMGWQEALPNGEPHSVWYQTVPLDAAQVVMERVVGVPQFLPTPLVVEA